MSKVAPIYGTTSQQHVDWTLDNFQTLTGPFTLRVVFTDQQVIIERALFSFPAINPNSSQEDRPLMKIS